MPADNKEFKSVLNLFGLKQIVKNPTRICQSSRTLIDIIATNNGKAINGVEVIPMGIGDHDMVGRVRKIRNMKFKSRLIECRNYR